MVSATNFIFTRVLIVLAFLTLSCVLKCAIQPHRRGQHGADQSTVAILRVVGAV